MQRFEFFPVTNSDYNALINVWEASVRATHHFLTEADIMGYRALILEQYFDQLHLHCIKVNGNITGFVGIYGELLQMLFVHPDGRGKGIGKALVNFVVSHHAVNKVDVNEQNEQAVGFYRHMGFEITERFDHDSAGKPFPVLGMTLKSTSGF